MDLHKELLLRLILLLSLLSFPALAQTQTYFQETQIATRAVPNSNPVTMPTGESKPLLLLSTYTKLRISVCPQAGFSLSGTGSIRLYQYHRYIDGGRWGYRPALDQPVTLSAAVGICQYIDLTVGVSGGYLHPATVGVTTTGGNVIVRIDPQ